MPDKTEEGSALGRWTEARALFPGLFLCLTIALAATFLSEHYGGPAMLFALLLGIAFHFLHEEGPCRPGIEFGARTVLRFGVALLGLRITVGDLAHLGWPALLTVAGLVALTIGSGLLLARLFGKGWSFGLLTGGAVAICGASAALAIAAILPASRALERNTLFTVVAVTTLSTIAMILYPPVFALTGLHDAAIGFTIGATIHDVAQVVGAGYSVSDTAGDTATLVKLLRVALLPVVLMIAVVFVRRGGTSQGKVALLPGFMVAFLCLAALNSVVRLPEPLRLGLDTLSRWALVAAISAIGVKTSLKSIFAMEGGHVVIVVLETLILMVAALAAVHWLLRI